MAKNRLTQLGLAAIFLVGLAALAALAHAQDPGPLAALGTAFTYQGNLRRDGTLYSGTCTMNFRLYDALSGGTLKGTVSNSTVPISNSLFTVGLDFGAGAFPGDRRWLEIDVNCPGDSGGPTILPRQELTAAPYALTSVSTTGLQGRPVAGTLPTTGQVLQWDGALWSPASLSATTNNHTHWGQTWTGAGTGLTLGGGSVGLSAAGTVTGVQGAGGPIGLYGRGVVSGVVGVGPTGLYGAGSTYGVYGSSGGNYGVYGTGSYYGVYGAGSYYGVSGNGSEIGVDGTGGSYGLYGTGPTGVYGTGSSFGVYGLSDMTGVYGTGSDTGVDGKGGSYGVRGQGVVTGVVGLGPTGLYGGGSAYGLYATSPATAVYGKGGSYGVYGSSGNYGVVGQGSLMGVYGTGSDAGVFGTGPVTGVVGIGGPNGVYGSGSYGVWGSGVVTGVVGMGGPTGVYGRGSRIGLYATGPLTGVYGLSTGSGFYNAGVHGQGTFGVVGQGVNVGVHGSGYTGVDGSGSIYGVYGSGNTGVYGTGSSYAGDFNGDVRVQGDLTVSGVKSAVVSTSQGTRALYAVESPESWFEDFGKATLADGRAMVTIDALYAETVNLQQDYHVFLTPRGDCRGLYVTALTPTTFEVRELGSGRATVDFDYRIVAKRRGQEALRLAAVKDGAR